MHAQTILQLYSQLIEAGYDDPALAEVQAAYELARQLFVGCYRPSEKPFCAHLVGTASALARWGERKEMVLAGLLHSAYLYGEFGDRTRGITPAKRRIVCHNTCAGAEALVERYTTTDQQFSELAQSGDVESRDVAVLKLADLFDECADAGPLYSRGKQLAEGLPHDRSARARVLQFAEQLIGPTAQADFDRVFHQIDACRVPDILVSDKLAFHKIQPGVPELRMSSTRRRLKRLASRLSFW